MHTFYGQLTYGLSFGRFFKLVVASRVPSGSGSSESVKQAVLPGTWILAWPSKLKTQGLESISTWILSPLAWTTMPYNSQCMASNKRLFEDLHLDQAEQQVGGINDGLVIAGQGTMVPVKNYM